MLKRKRGNYEGRTNGGLSAQKQSVQERITQSKKLLHRALKTAKGFERQKLGKRIKLATKDGKTEDIARINREIEVLKGLDLDKVTEAHLHKTLMKIKAFAESDLLPQDVKNVVPKAEGDEQTVAALNNVTSGMLNMKPVKDVMAQAVSGVYVAMGLPAPTSRKPQEYKHQREIEHEMTHSSTVSKEQDGIPESHTTDIVEGDDESGGSWYGIKSDDEEEEGSEGHESLDEETIAKYENLLGGSSDEESFDEANYVREKKPSEVSKRLSLSLSPTPSRSPTPIPSPSLSSSESDPAEPQPLPEKVAKVKTTTKAAPIKPAGSTFLPTLMGGYWSGSEEEASDLEDFRPVKKNRKGQQARRAIAEKKYGEKAKHIQSGQGPANPRGKDDDWDPKRGAKDSSRGRAGKFGNRGGGGGSRAYDRPTVDRGTGENAVAVQPKKRGMGKKDDVGVLHPSWQAAKQAKDAKKMAKFEGKKVVFD